MMKIIAYILSFYILALTAIPCIDTPQDNTLHKTELSQKTTGSHQNKADNCSPFWPCSCCISPVISQGFTLQFNCFSFSQKHFAEYKSAFVSSICIAIFLELTLFEKDVEKVSIGQKIRFFVNNETEYHVATIYQTGKSINADKTYKVYASVQGVCKNVLPGMYVNAVIEATTNKVAALPSDAVVSFEDKDYIFVFDKNKEENGKPFTEYRMIQVHKGVTDVGYTEVRISDEFDIKTAKAVIKGAYSLLSAKKNSGEMSCD